MAYVEILIKKQEADVILMRGARKNCKTYSKLFIFFTVIAMFSKRIDSHIYRTSSHSPVLRKQTFRTEPKQPLLAIGFDETDSAPSDRS